MSQPISVQDIMNDDAWGLLWDYIRVAHNKAEKKTNLLRQACYNYLKSKGVGIEDCKLIAQCEVAAMLWQIVTETHVLFFKTYKNACGVDFSKDFEYANMSICGNKWLLITEELGKRAKGINFNDNLRCRHAWKDLKAEIDRTEFFDEAAGEALGLNEGIIEKYVA